MVEALTAIGVAAAVTMALAVYRSDEIQDVRLDAHAETISTHGDRLDTLEGPEVLLQLASAEEKVERLEDAAEQTDDNATAIAQISATQEAQGHQLERLEAGQDETNRTLREILIRLPNDRAAMTPAPPPE